MSTDGSGRPRRPQRTRRPAGGRRMPGPEQRDRMLRIGGLVAVVAVAVVLLATWIVSGPLLGISSVTVKGYTGPYRAEVQRTAELVAETGSMVRLPSGDMRKALTRFPGVLDATIQRDWPRSITVDVEMGEPVAILQVEGGGRYLLSPSGQVMGKAGTRGGLPVIVVTTPPAGGVLTGRGPRAALTFIGWLPPEIAGRIRDLKAVGGGLQGKLNNGLVLRLGSATNLAEKAQALVAVLSQADPKALDAAAYLDLSKPTRPMLGSSLVITRPPDGTTTDGTTTDGTSTDGTPTDGTATTDGTSTDGTDTTLNP